MPEETDGITGTDTKTGESLQTHTFTDTQAAQAGKVNETGITLLSTGSSHFPTEGDTEVDSFLLIWYGGSRSRGEGIEMIRVRIKRKRGKVEVIQEATP
jgi:hypothetical protein